VSGHTHIFATIDALYAALEERWELIARESIADHGAFHVALAGGGTPRNLYAKLPQRKTIDEAIWHNTHIYVGDERCVPQDHPDSNFRMVQESLLSVAPLLPNHVHAMFSSGLTVDENVQRYAALLRDEVPSDASGHPVFDLVLLGMGEDGHTASLFPETEILHESEKSVAAQYVQKLNAWRLSLTFSTINAAKHVVVLVVGGAKAEVLSEILSAEKSDTPSYPIKRVDPVGQLDWYMDAAAARLLTP
jgi:6-phosphogluconolactonase